MPIGNNSLTRAMPGLGIVIGRIAFSGGSTPALSNLSGLADTDTNQVTVVDNGTGDVSVVVANFKGNAGYAVGFGRATLVTGIVAGVAASYSGDTLTVRFKVFDAVTVAVDDDFDFLILAY